MTEFIVGLVFGIVLALVVGRLVLSYAVRRAEHNLEAIVKALEEVSANNILARVEEEAGMFYVYNTKDGTFLAQGRTATELREHLESRWPNATIAVTEGDTAVLERLRATITDATA